MRFIKSAGTTLAFKIIAMSFGLGISVLIGRAMGPEGRGVYGLVMTVIMISSVFGVFGLGAANAYFIAKDRNHARVIGWQSLFVGIAGAAVSTVAVLFVRHLAPAVLKGLEGPVLVITLLMVPLFLWGNLYARAYLGLGRVVAFNTFETFGRGIFFGAAAVVILFMNRDMTFYLASVLACLSLLTLGYIIRYFQISPSGKTKAREFFTLSISYGVRPWIAAVFTWITIRSGIFFVNYFKGTAEAGLFSVAQQISELLIIVPSVVGAILFPRVASGDSKDLTAKVLRTMNAVFLPLFLLLAFLAEPIITLLFGAEFLPSAVALRIILPGAYLLGLEVIIAGDIAGRGYPWPVALIWIPVFAINAIGYMILVPRYGIDGAALATSISYALIFVYMTFQLRKMTSFTLSQLFIPRLADLRALLSSSRFGSGGQAQSNAAADDTVERGAGL
ncbi:MAG: polysaccharide biosynthesis C-terminal domain-containing protein [Candidatus Zixiibacteriota bacterium]